MKRFAAFFTVALFACHHGHRGHGAHAVSSTPSSASDAPMTEANLVVPLAAGRTQAWQDALHELIGPRYQEYQASRRRFGLTSQMTFLQKTPMGDFAVIHMTGPDVHASFHAMSTSQDPWDVKWRDLTQNLHGMDFAQGEKVTPKVEPLLSTDVAAPALGVDPQGTPFMFLLPLAPDALPRVRALAAEIMGARHAAYVQARLDLGISREFVCIETTAQGNALVFYWLASDPATSLQKLASSQAPFDQWLRTASAALHPISVGAVAEIAKNNQLIARYPAVGAVSSP